MAQDNAADDEANGPSEEVALLQKPPSERSEHEVQKIQRNVGGIGFFAALDAKVRQQCCYKLRHEYVEAGRILFEIGDEPRLFYVVLSGKVGVYVKDASMASDAKLRDRRSRSKEFVDPGGDCSESTRSRMSSKDDPASATIQAEAQALQPPLGPPTLARPQKRRPSTQRRISSIMGYMPEDVEAAEQAEAILYRVGRRGDSPDRKASFPPLWASLRTASPMSARGPGSRLSARDSRPATAMVLPPCDGSLTDIAGFSRIEGAPSSPRGPSHLSPTAVPNVSGKMSMLTDAWLREAPGANLLATDAMSRIGTSVVSGGQDENSEAIEQRTGSRRPSRARAALRVAVRGVGMMRRPAPEMWKPILASGPCQKLPIYMKQVVSFQRGQAFGEAAMLSDQGRLATCATLENCHFAVLDRGEFLAILAGTQEQANQERIDFLKSVHMFNTMLAHSLEKIASKLHLRKMVKNDKVYQAGSDVIQIFFVKEGEFALRRSVGSQLGTGSQTAAAAGEPGDAHGAGGAAATADGSGAGEAAAGSSGHAPGHAGGTSAADAAAVRESNAAHPSSSSSSTWCTVTLVTRPHVFGLAEYVCGAHTHTDCAVCQSAVGAVYMIPARELIPHLAPSIRTRLEQGALAQEQFLQQRMLMMRQLIVPPEPEKPPPRWATAPGQDRRGNSEARATLPQARSRSTTAPAANHRKAYNPEGRLKAIRAAKGTQPACAPMPTIDISDTQRAKMQSLCIMEVPNFSRLAGAPPALELVNLSHPWPLDKCKVVVDDTADPLKGRRPTSSPPMHGSKGFEASGDDDAPSPRSAKKEKKPEGKLPPWLGLLHMDLRASPRRRGWRPPPQH